MDDARLVAVAKTAVEIDDTADEGRRENPDAAVVEQVDPERLARFSNAV